MAGYLVGIDVGGTFTDFALVRGRRLVIHKVSSTPLDPAKAILQGLRDLEISSRSKRGGEQSVTYAHGSTVATNALLERKGARTAFVTTGGFEDILEIGRQARPSLYDLRQERPPALVPRELRLGVRERIDATGKPLLTLDTQEADRVAEAAKGLDVEAVAICLLFSFLNPTHEAMLRHAFQKLHPLPFLSVSSEVLPEYREYERASTVTVNAYVGPVMARYLNRLGSALGQRDSAEGPRRLRIMQSSGGSISAEVAARQPVRTILSGPAGGVTGAFAVAAQAGFPQVITLDMGGTSTDVALCPGRIQKTTSATLGDIPISTPMMDIHTVGAGGGSISRVDLGGALVVGPESAGADPGPACYGKGQEATVTDANLVLGRIHPDHFLGGRMPLDLERARASLAKLAAQMGTDARGAASGVVRVVNANMERAVRTISLERGFDPRDFTLLAFGGAGPQHACELAEELRIPRVLVPAYPGALSAFGVAIADVVKEYSHTVLLPLQRATHQALGEAFQALERLGLSELLTEGIPERKILLQRQLDLRYTGQSYELMVDCPPLNDKIALAAAALFHAAHEQRFGYANPSYPVEVVNVRLTARGITEKSGLRSATSSQAKRRRAALSSPGVEVRAAQIDEREVIFQGHPIKTAFYQRDLLHPGQSLPGPAVVLQMDATTVIPPGWVAWVDPFGNLVGERSSS